MKYLALLCALFCSASTLTYAVDVNPQEAEHAQPTNMVEFRDVDGNVFATANIDATELDLCRKTIRDKAVRSLPPEIGNLTNLEVLFLNRNRIQHLPPEIGNLTNLRALHLDRGSVQDLPPEIGQLTNLEILRLAETYIQNLPPEIALLQKLQKLDLRGTNIRNLPPEIAQLTNLQELDLGNTAVQNLPAKFEDLINLQYLSMDKCQLAVVELPRGQGPIGVYVSHNPLEQAGPHHGRPVELERRDHRNPHAHFNAVVFNDATAIWHALHTFATLPNQRDMLDLAFVNVPNKGQPNYNEHLARISINPMQNGENHGHITVHRISTELEATLCETLNLEGDIREAFEQLLNDVVAMDAPPSRPKRA